MTTWPTAPKPLRHFRDAEDLILLAVEKRANVIALAKVYRRWGFTPASAMELAMDNIRDNNVPSLLASDYVAALASVKRRMPVD